MSRFQLVPVRAAIAGMIAVASLGAIVDTRCPAAEQKRTYLIEKFQDGDIPTGQDFADMIDSSLNLLDDGLTAYRIGVNGSTGSALRLNAGDTVDSLLTYAPVSTNPPLAPLWAGQFGFLPLEYQDASLEPHYGFLQLRMDSGPLPPPPGLPGPAIFVEYLVWQTEANVALTTFVVPEPIGRATGRLWLHRTDRLGLATTNSRSQTMTRVRCRGTESFSCKENLRCPLLI